VFALSNYVPRAGASANVAIPALIEALRDDGNTGIANHAADILPRFGKAALPALLDAFQEDRGRFHGRVAVVLGAIDLSIDGVVPALLATVRDPKSTARVQAALMVARKGEAVVSDLSAALNDPDDETRRLAGAALGQIGTAAAAAVPALIERLKSETDRRWAARALRAIDPKAAAAAGVAEAESV
jgi:HEAT repeat protein